MNKPVATVLLLAGISVSAAAGASNLRIIGGDKVSLSQYPYMAALVGRGDSTEQAFCGASVINQNWVVTAAHCLTGVRANGLDVLTGVSALSKPESGQRIKASQIIIHPDYNDNSVQNDIALIELSSPTSAPAIRAATKADASAFEPGQAVSVAGWGNLLAQGEKFPDVLHAVDLQVSDFSSCSDVYGGLDSTQICASVPGGKKDSCQGDSGGPLVAKTASGPIQVGIVSFGDVCASATHPGVYTRVSEFSEFLKRAGVSGSVEVAAGGEATDENDADKPSTDDGAQDTGTDLDPDNNGVSEIVEMTDVDHSPTAGLDSNDVQLTVLVPFSHVEELEASLAFVEIYNGGEDTISLSNIQLPDNVSIDAQSEDCTSIELRPEQACYFDLIWAPVDNSELDDTLSIDVYDGAKNQTVTVSLTGSVVEQIDIGDVVDWPDAEYFSSYPEEWELDNSDVVTGDAALSSSMQNTDLLNLSGTFDEQQDHELQFNYQLSGANCFIYIDDDLAYELAAFEQWQVATLNVPAGAEVRWEFRSTERARGQRMVRLDALKVSGAGGVSAQPEQPLTGAAEAAVNFSPETGAGSSGCIALVGLVLLLASRRVGSRSSRISS